MTQKLEYDNLKSKVRALDKRYRGMKPKFLVHKGAAAGSLENLNEDMMSLPDKMTI